MLSSWKEIAHFFGKGVRTVQRWEKTLDLPIHRPPGAPSNVVLARTSDLEEWMHRGPAARAVAQEATSDMVSPSMVVSLTDLEAEVKKLAIWAGVNVHVEADSPVDERVASLTRLVSQVRGVLSKAPAARAA